MQRLDMLLECFKSKSAQWLRPRDLQYTIQELKRCLGVILITKSSVRNKEIKSALRLEYYQDGGKCTWFFVWAQTISASAEWVSSCSVELGSSSCSYFILPFNPISPCRKQPRRPINDDWGSRQTWQKHGVNMWPCFALIASIDGRSSCHQQMQIMSSQLFALLYKEVNV